MDDATLTHQGVQSGQGSVLLIACGALSREIVALQRLNGWDHLTLRCLPAILHNSPEKIPDEVRQAIRVGKAEGFEHIRVAYADCGTGGLLDTVCEAEGVPRIEGPHCYAFFDGLEAFAARADEEIGAFFLTDFLAKQFDAFVTQPLGLDRHPELRDMYFAHYDRLVYLAQSDDAALTEAARAAAVKLGLRFERRFTGFGALEPFLAPQT
ncbi:MAG: DUF1638 domain-containing protein [Pseudomonadota bacterium]